VAFIARFLRRGLFGIHPDGLKSVELTPRLPEDWKSMALRKIHAFSDVFDIEIIWNTSRIQLKVITKTKMIFEIIVNGKPLTISL
jgi:hypothetical protein